MRRVLPLVSTVALFAVAMVVTPVVVRPALTVPRRERRYARPRGKQWLDTVVGQPTSSSASNYRE